jgi:hypothetical protein
MKDNWSAAGLRHVVAYQDLAPASQKDGQELALAVHLPALRTQWGKTSKSNNVAWVKSVPFRRRPTTYYPIQKELNLIIKCRLSRLARMASNM